MLPSTAKVSSMRSEGLEGRDEAYVFTLTVSRGAALELCDQGGLGGAELVRKIPSTAKQSLGDVTLTERSRACEGSAPADPRWYRFVLIDDGDPAEVRLVLQPSSH